MPRTHERSLSPDIPDVVKRIKISHEPSKDGNSPSIPSPTSPLVDPSDKFTEGLFNPDNISRLHNSYKDNSPFKFALIERLFRHDLLEKVKDECLSELSFAEKETDIYKVNQTGDLASLNFLAPNQLALLSNLRTLRDALYSTRFRKFLQSVTGCGPLSGVKQDMSINSYSKGCHLLNHDDVIGTRRVSYILYMPLPSYQMWQKDWGGALELYPVRLGEDNQLEPEPIPEKSIPPSWNQFIFFEVQPGRSFHSVEEVVVGGEEDGRERLSISGWFHAAQEGEEGYEPVQESAVKSSREQLTSSSTSTFFNSYQDNTDDIMLPGDDLPELYISYLSEFMNPVYLQPRTMKALAARFVEESSLELHSFLSNSLAKSLESRLRELDSKDGLGPERAGHIPPHTAGTGGGWIVKGPPHKWRYSVLKPRESGNVLAVFPRAAHVSSDEIIRSLQDELFASPAFRAWLSIVSRLMPLRYRAEARRFRPGLDYTLATSEEKEARLDVVLDLTPEAKDRSTDDGRWQTKQQDDRGWHTGEWGGWECYMAPHNEEDDPAVYRSGSSKVSSTQQSTPGHTSEGGGSGSGGVNGSSSSTNTSKQGSVHGSPHESKGNTPPTPMDEDEESTLLTAQPGFNRLLLVLRDERVMRFVKYVSASADGSRWDICGEYEVGMVQEEEEEVS